MRDEFGFSLVNTYGIRQEKVIFIRSGMLSVLYSSRDTAAFSFFEPEFKKGLQIWMKTINS